MVKKDGDKPELLTKDEMDRLINVVSGDLYFSTFYKILRYSGRRTGEIYGTIREKKLFGGIKFKDIDFDNEQIKTQILKTKKRKEKAICPNCHEKTTIKNKFCPLCGSAMPESDPDKLKYHVVDEKYMPMRPEVKQILQVYINTHKPKFKENDYIFQEYSLSYLKKKIKSDCQKASINKRFSLHGFRHYFISMCKLNGMSNEDIAKWTGHVDASTVNRYNQLTSRDIQDKINKVDL